MYFSCLITAQRHTRIISDACCDFSQVHCMPKLSVAFELWLKTTTRTSVQIMNWNQLHTAQTGWAQKDSKGVSPGRENKYSTTLLNHVMLNLWYRISQYVMTSKSSHGLANNNDQSGWLGHLLGRTPFEGHFRISRGRMPTCCFMLSGLLLCRILVTFLIE